MDHPPLGGIHEAGLYVDDLDAAARFWQRLGFKTITRKEGRHAFFRAGRDVLLVFDPDATSRGDDVPPHGAHGPGHIAFDVPDREALERWRRHLADLDVPVEAETEWPSGGRSLYFRDPSGNSIELITAGTWT